MCRAPPLHDLCKTRTQTQRMDACRRMAAPPSAAAAVHLPPTRLARSCPLNGSRRRSRVHGGQPYRNRSKGYVHHAVAGHTETTVAGHTETTPGVLWALPLQPRTAGSQPGHLRLQEPQAHVVVYSCGMGSLSSIGMLQGKSQQPHYFNDITTQPTRRKTRRAVSRSLANPRGPRWAAGEGARSSVVVGRRRSSSTPHCSDASTPGYAQSCPVTRLFSRPAWLGIETAMDIGIVAHGSLACAVCA